MEIVYITRKKAAYIPMLRGYYAVRDKTRFFMQTIEAIKTRRSIRKYLKKEISLQNLEEIIKAAMYAPSACNEQPWHFIIVNDKNLLEQVPKFSPFAKMCIDSPCSILVCSDKKTEKIPDMWGQDCSAAVQNLMLAAHELGIGSVWTAVYPQKKIIEGFNKLLKLPEHLIPFAFIVLGYPAEKPEAPNRFMQERIHFNSYK